MVRRRLVLVAGVCFGMLAGWCMGASAQSAPPAPPDADAPPDAAIRFNFKNATFDQVLDFFARASGLPIVRETDVPEGTLDYLSPESYDLPEALRVLNVVLQSRGVMLRASNDMLYLQKLTEMQREDIPTFIGELPGDVTPDQVITVVRPLNIALAKPLAERLATMVAAYGSIAAMEQQNSLIITETAAQVRRLLTIIDELDREDPQGQVEIFKIRHTTAAALMEPLKALMSQKVEKYIINKDGQQVKVEEDSMPGLSISADERTNAIIAKGVQSRLDNLREMIDLLDVPETGGAARAMRTVRLGALGADEAVAKLNVLYGALPEAQRPTIIPLGDQGRITIVGPESAITEGLQLLREIDGADVTLEGDDRTVAVLELDHAQPAAVIQALEGLLNGRQRSALKLVAGPDGRSLIVGGLGRDLAAVESVLTALDRPARVDIQVRLLRLSSGGRDPQAVIDRARDLYDRQADPDNPNAELSIEFEAGERLLTLVGPAEALDRFSGALRMVESNAVVDRETRRLELVNAAPSRIAASLAPLARQMLQPHDGTEYLAPALEPVDALDTLIVTALPEQFAIIESLVQTLDAPSPADYQFRVIPLAGIDDPDALLQRAQSAFDILTMGYDADDLPDPSVEVDALTGHLLLSGRVESVRLWEQALGEARKLLPPARSARMIALVEARAADVIGPLRDLLGRMASDDGAREIPPPAIEIVEPTNSLYIVAEPAQHATIEGLVRQLDRFEPTDMPPLRLLQVRAADANQLAQLLQQRYAARPADQRRDVPVSITADAATNTLIVTAHEEVFQDVRGFVESVNKANEQQAERETMIFPLKLARAADLAVALDKLYPEPPMPLDRRGQPLPHLREPREIQVSADAATNTLIIEAPVERRASFEALVEQLDRVQLPPTAELRTYHLQRGDPAEIARTLTELARRGVLSEQPEDGSKPVEVLIQAEPMSRTLIVAGDAITFAKTEQMLTDLQAVPVPRSLRVFDVAGADPQDLADRAQRLYEAQTADMPDSAPVSVEVDRENGALLVVAEDEALIRFATILNGLRDSIGPAPDVRVIALEFADAGDVRDFLQGLLESQLARVAGRTGPPPLFEVIEHTNSLLIAAQPDDHAIIDALARGMDRLEPRATPPLRIMQLRIADAANLANALNRQYGLRPVEERNDKPVTITADPNTNSLIVAAHPGVLPEIQSIVEELNLQDRVDYEGREIRIFPLQVARAEELAKTIDEMYPAPPVPVDRRGVPQYHLQQPREVVVRGDRQTNSLIVDAPAQRMAGFEKLVEQLDRQQVVDETEVRTYEIVHADLNSISTTLRELAANGSLGPAGLDRRTPITIAVEPAGGALIVSGPVEIFARVEKVLADLDVKRIGPATVLRFFRLEHARAESIAAMMREVLLTRLAEDVPESGGGGGSGDARALLNVTSDPKTNTLIISAPAALMPVAEQLIEQLDNASAALGEEIVRVRPLTFADAREVSQALSEALPNMTSKATGEPMDVRLIPAAGSNALILVGVQSDVQELEALIEPLDARPAMDAIDARTFKLAHAEARGIASIIQNLLRDQMASDPRLILERIRRGRGDLSADMTIRVEADERTNSLIVSGPQRIIALAETLIERLDEPDESSQRTFRTFTPSGVDAAAAAQSIQRIIDSTMPAGRRSTLQLIAEPQTGAIVVVGREDEVERALAMLKEWDGKALAPPQMDFRIAALAHADASVVASTLTPMLNDQARWPASLRAVARAGLPVGRPTVTAEARGNRLLISVPQELMPLADQLIAQLDQPRAVDAAGGGAMDIRIFNLTQAKAPDVAEAIRAALEAKRRNEPGLPEVSISPEPSSNSVIVAAPAGQLEAIESMIAGLDQGVATDQVQVRTVFLAHALAEDVAPIVEQLLATEQMPEWMRFDLLWRRGVNPDTTPPVRVVADSRLNAVVISAPPAVLNIAEEMVAQLDVDQAEVPGAGAGSARSVRVLVVENADAAELAANLDAIFADREESEPPPVIRVDRASNALLVRATEAQFRTIGEVAAQVDRATIATSTQMRMIPIDPARADAADIAETLRRLLDRSSGSTVEVISLEELIQRRRKVGDASPPPTQPPERGDTGPPPGPGGGGGVSMLPAAPFGLVPALLIGAIQDGDVAGGAVAGESDSATSDITIAVDPRTNSLIVIGAPRAVERLMALARQLQDQIPAAPSVIRYLTLPDEVDASQLATLISQTIQQMTPPGGSPGDIRRRVTIVADATANALIIASNDRDFETIADLVTAMSLPPASEQLIVKVYPLQTVTAERAASSVRSLIEPQQNIRGPARGRGRQVDRLRNLAIKLLAPGKSIDAVFDPNRIAVSSDAQTNSLIVMGPADAIGFIDQFIELIDQTPVNVQSTLKLYPLQHALADDLADTLRRIFRTRFQSLRAVQGESAIVPEFAGDERTNTLLATANPEQLAEIDNLLMQLDRPLEDATYPLQIIELTAAQPAQAASLLQQTIIGTNQQRRASTLIIPDDNAGLLLVRAPDEVFAEIQSVLAQIDRKATSEFKVRTIVLQHASARGVADALQRFFDDRARIASAGRGRRAQSRQVSITGIDESRTLLIAANDDDYAQIERLVAQFDTAQAAGALSFRVFMLRHAKASEIQETVQGLVDDLTWNQGSIFFFFNQFGPQSNQNRRGTLAVRADDRLNALIVTGEGDKFQVVEQLIEVLDAPRPEGTQRIVRLYPIRDIALATARDVLTEIFADPRRQQRWWLPADPNEVRIRPDERTSSLIVSATETEHAEIAAIIRDLETQAGMEGGDQSIAVLPVRFGNAGELARTLSRFLADRADATNAPPPSATITASETANALVVSANDADSATIRDLLSKLDQEDATGQRVTEILVLQQGNADEIARIVQQQFSRAPAPGTFGQGVTITPDARTNSLIISAPAELFAQAEALIARLDAPAHADETIIRTYELQGGQARDVVAILTETLQLDTRGETSGITIRPDEGGEAVEVRARIVADRRSNSIIVTATEESFPIIESLIAKIDQKPSVSPVEYRIIPLQHAVAIDVAFTLGRFTRGMADDSTPEPRVDYNRIENHLIVAATAAQFEQFEKIIREIDQPSTRARITDFVPLRFAEAQKVREALSVFYGPFAIEADTPGKINVSIVADPATNSLVISADANEWENIRALLAELDSEEYDSSLQLRVMPLSYADARSVANAINQAFQGQIERNRGGGAQPRQPQGGDDQNQDRRDPGQAPTVLVEADEWVRAAAEPQTNSVVISASRQNILKIERIIEQLDVADYATLPPPQIINVRTGDPVALAASLTQLYEQSENARGRKALRIVGDPTSNSIIVRAEADEFTQIRALAEALQAEASSQGLTVHVLKLDAAPAARVATAIREAFDAKARQANQPLSIQVDAQANALVIASTGVLFDEIRQTVAELDRLVPAAGHGVFIIELEHIAPDAAKSIIETIGLDQPQRDDSVSKLVTEPIRVSTLAGRQAIMVIANPADRDTIVQIIKAIDAAPDGGLAQADTRIFRLRRAQASAVAIILQEILRPAEQQTDTSLARAVQEQVRRLAVQTGDQSVSLDLTKPIKVVPDDQLNALVVSSTAGNIAALEHIISRLDDLPITGAVTVQIYPLQNIAAEQFARIVFELFQQGRQLGREPGTDLRGMPAGAVGPALLDDIAISVDERTNTVIVAGKEDTVALVEVLKGRLDSDVATGWVEPRIITLRHADATDLAATIQAIVVDGVQNLPQATPLQRQIGRLRMARLRENGGTVLESDVFQPMTRLLVRAEPQLNALVLVGTPANLEIVAELAAMLDVEAASPSAAVRIYPVEHASAARLAQTITRLFDQQVDSKAIRPEDRVIVQPDDRTNALIVTTSPRSFAVLEDLLRMLDAEIAPDLRELRRIELTNASATRLARLIQELMDARLERLRRVQPETAELERATIVPDERTNSLIVAAGNESFDVIRALAADLDQALRDDASLVDVITVAKGNLERIADTVNAIMARRYADLPGEIRASQVPLVMTDPRTSSLLVAANPEDLNSIRGLVEKLASTPEHPALGLHIIPLDVSYSAEQLAPRVERLMEQRRRSLGDSQTALDNVTIDADPRSNSLIVAATDENLAIVRTFIEVLMKADIEPETGRETDIVTLAKSRASDVVDLLDDLYVQEANRAKGQNMVRVTADDRLNAVLINAPPDDVRALRSLIAQLDGARPSNILEIQYIPLKSANALETVSLIEDVLSGRGIGTRRGAQQATVLKYLHRIAREVGLEPDPVDETAPVEMEVSAAVRESITLTPDLRTNTVIVSAPEHSMRMIERMIRDLDESSIGAQNVRIFKLVNADATAMAEIITDLFNIRQGNTLLVLKPRDGSAAPPSAPGPAPAPGPDGAIPAGPPVIGSLSGTDLTAVPDERQQLSITVDSRTNSLLVSGTPSYLDLVSRVVEELDALEANERDTFVYPLRNATAADVASVIGQFIQEEQQKLLGTLSDEQLGSASRLLEREVTIVGDEKSNTVLVSASPRYMERVQEIIHELDVDPPQVLIQVLLAEVTLDDADEWGVDFSFESEVGGTTVGGGYGLASALLAGLGAPNLSIVGADFDLLILALQAQGRLQVLSNPTVIAANNQEAFIQIGETIRVPDQTSFDLGSQQTSVTPEDVGVILTVTPSINPDGFVRMVIQPEVSELSSETTQISEDFESPIITRRTLDTTVTVRDGQTIVIGGLISDRFERREQKVPILGDIPLIGELFKNRRETTTKTEFLVVLTPHVIYAPSEFGRIEELTTREIERLSIPEEVKQAIMEHVRQGTGQLYDAEGNIIPLRTGQKE